MKTTRRYRIFTVLRLSLLVSLCASCLIQAAERDRERDAAPAQSFIVEHGVYRVPPGSALRQRLIVAAVGQENRPHRMIVPGQVDALPSRTINLSAPLTGRVTELHVELGDTVRKGQLLAVLASGDMAQAVADYDKARDALDLARKTAIRTAGVEKAGASAAKDREAADSALTQANAEMVRAKTRLDALRGSTGKPVRTGQLTIFAPVSGVVTALNIGQGSVVGDPTATLITLTDIGAIWVSADVPEDQIGAVHLGQDASVTFSAYPGARAEGKVAVIGSAIAADTRRLPVRIALPNPAGHLKPNMFATVSLSVADDRHVVVPQSALLMNNDSTTVLVERSPWTFVRRRIELGTDEDSQARVLSGLKAGDRIVVRGGVLMND
ncbi:efflux RND transporter periplasmic adaptor subunit [Robbsia sp. Bb-Pol-6]|uniref:Efflux RND transporter periplasmic adaptor subunit n=1 Tax=Robbsia betulipollinis TaxID=2981849 RepID=A0ABT3ZS00_9BURK|nr:efflux RND transporter periplasmic adaptor subunit [Robbsia betulipollinis]MCY0389333.1 efflux RND transporter periplasmic adaptor subunit [Robbsia betulipollinis]